MNNTKTQYLAALLGGVDMIVAKLSIETLPEETQIIVIQGFADIVFKRLLLRVPQEHIEDVKLAFRDPKIAADIEQFRDILIRVIPNLEVCVREEMANATSDIRKLLQKPIK